LAHVIHPSPSSEVIRMASPKSVASKSGGGSQRIRGQLPSYINLPKWVTADQIRSLQTELGWNPELNVDDKLIEFALEQDGSLKLS